MSIDPSIITSAAKILPVVADVSKVLKERKILEQVFDFLTQKKPIDILILGATGVGKSSVLGSLFGEAQFIPRNIRTELVEKKAAKSMLFLYEFLILLDSLDIKSNGPLR